MRKSIIGVDLGGTNIRVAAISLQGTVLHRTKQATDPETGKDLVIEKLLQMLERSVKREREAGRRPQAVGIGAPGVIFVRRGIIVSSPNLPDWVDVPLKAIVRRRIALPVVVENDANAAAYGEKWMGAGKGADSLICLTLGTGVGGGIILNGRVWHGEDGMAAELGHTTVNPDGPQCKCGNTGCLEVYASATGIVREVKRRIIREDSILKTSFQGREDRFSAPDIFRAAKAGDRVCLSVIRQMGRFLGIGIANMVNTFNPQIIVLSGGVTAAWRDFIPIVKEEVTVRAFKVPRLRAKIVRARLGDNAGVIGAAGAALQSIKGGNHWL